MSHQFPRPRLAASLVLLALAPFACAPDAVAPTPEVAAPSFARVRARSVTAPNGLAADTVAIGGTVQLTATLPSPGKKQRTTTWTSRAPSIARVNGTGLVTGLAAGAAYIVASNGAASDSARITVIDTTTPPDTVTPPDTTPPPPPPPPPSCGITGTQPVPTSAFAKPAYLTPTREPDFGTTFTRITGDPGTAIGGGVSGTWPAISAHHYSKDQPWSADGRLLFLSRFSPSLAFQYLFLDGVTYQPLFGRNVPGPEARWHPTKPDTMIYVTNSGGAGYWDVRRDTWAARVAPSGYSSASMGNNEGDPSYDGRYVAILATRSDGRLVAYAIDLVAATKGPDIDLAAAGASSVDWASVSASGRYIVAAVNDRQTYVWDRATGALVRRETSYIYGHADLGMDGNGADVIWGVIGGGPSASLKTFTSLTLATGAAFISTPATTYNGHASTRAVSRPGWGYGVVNTSDGSVMDGELFAATLSAPMTVARWGRHRSNVTSGTSGFNYNSEPHAVPNHDGTKFLFASNWGSTSVVSTIIASCP